MILLGRKQQAYSEVCLYWPETRELSITNTSEEGDSERTEAADILCSPCGLPCHDARAAGTRSAADPFTVFTLPLALGFSLGQQNCTVKTQWVSLKSYFCLSISCACTHMCFSASACTYNFHSTMKCAMHIYWNAFNFAADIAVCLNKWKRILRIQLVLVLIPAAALHSWSLLFAVFSGFIFKWILSHSFKNYS